jgi:hypothetical protein
MQVIFYMFPGYAQKCTCIQLHVLGLTGFVAKAKSYDNYRFDHLWIHIDLLLLRY